jgi:putative ABC transport system permease protein
LPLRFTAEPASLVGGALIGLIISMVTVWATSQRIGRLNVIRAVRDLPDPPRTGRRLRSLALASSGVVVGGLGTVAGIAGRNGSLALLGPAIAAWSAAPLLARRLLSRRLATSLPALAVLVWSVFAFTIVPRVFADSEVPVFVVQGLVLVASAVTLAVANGDLFQSVADRLGRAGRGLAARLGLANPLARRSRTGLLLGMYAIVVFVLVMLSAMARMFTALGPQTTDETRGGYDIVVDSNPANPATVAQLETAPHVEAAAALMIAAPRFTVDPNGDPWSWPMTGVDSRLLARGTPKLSARDRAFVTDRDAWQAVLTDPTLAIVPDFFLQAGGPPEGGIEVGDSFTVVNPVNGSEHRLTAAAIVDDWASNGIIVTSDAVTGYAGQASASRAYVAVDPGAAPDAVADTLTATLIPNGVDARTFTEIVDEGLAQNNRFFSLLQGFLALGLAIGIAGLSVVMVRAVRERRRQIGMLRAMGFQARTVRAAFLIEAAFIAVQGIVVGATLGLITAWSLLSNSETFGDQSIPFQVPWLGLTALVVAALGASLAAVYAPATKASRIPPAAALRLAE